MTVAQATKAALTLADLPKGWDGGVAVDPSPSPGAATTQYDPADCQIVVGNPLRSLDAPSTSVRGQYFVREPLEGITELIYSWPTTQQPLVQRIATALPHCTTVKGTTSLRTGFSMTVKEVQMPGLKDGIALRTEMVDADTPDRIFVLHSATVVRGGTVLRIFGVSDTFPTDAAFAQLLTKAVARLDASRH
ncbi:hypothetical protein ACFWUU_38905 [Kribbella sp. NPDC058693]|uniref:hypothetical protein n=1 Tax=Kribbella sp. NPDC058693 TaxID=3346602 RepID=UPI00364F6C60